MSAKLVCTAGSPQYAASEIAAKNWPPMQRADILNRRLAFRRHQFTLTHKQPLTVYYYYEVFSLHHCQHFANKAEIKNSNIKASYSSIWQHLHE